MAAAPQVRIEPATLRDLTYTAANARLIDKAEILASGPETMQAAAGLTWHSQQEFGGCAFAAWLDDNPELVCGFVRQSPLTPWLFSAWMWGTDKTAICIPELARYCRANLYKTLVVGLGATRVEARSYHEHKCAHRFLQWAGFARECDLIDWGRSRARFVLFAMRVSDFDGGGHLLRGTKRAAATGAAAAVA